MEFHGRLLTLSIWSIQKITICSIHQRIQTFQVNFVLVIISAKLSPSLQVFFNDTLASFLFIIEIDYILQQTDDSHGLNTHAENLVRWQYCATWWDWHCSCRVLWQPKKEWISGWTKNQQRKGKNHAQKPSQGSCTTKISRRIRSCRRLSISWHQNSLISVRLLQTKRSCLE